MTDTNLRGGDVDVSTVSTLMGWVRLDDARSLNAKLRRAGFEARGLDEAAICQVARDLSDGFIAVSTVEMIAKAHNCVRWRRLVAVLVDVGRWEPCIDGWMIHDYLEFNPSKADWEREKERKRAAGRKGGLARAQAEAQAPALADAQADAKARAQAGTQADPTRPDPIVVKPPPPTLTRGAPDVSAEEADFIRKTATLVARRQLAAARNVTNPNAWVAKATMSIAAEHREALHLAYETALPVESAADAICPPPSPPKWDGATPITRNGRTFLPGTGWV